MDGCNLFPLFGHKFDIALQTPKLPGPQGMLEALPMYWIWYSCLRDGFGGVIPVHALFGAVTVERPLWH